MLPPKLQAAAPVRFFQYSPCLGAIMHVPISSPPAVLETMFCANFCHWTAVRLCWNWYLLSPSREYKLPDDAPHTPPRDSTQCCRSGRHLSSAVDRCGVDHTDPRSNALISEALRLLVDIYFQTEGTRGVRVSCRLAQPPLSCNETGRSYCKVLKLPRCLVGASFLLLFGVQVQGSLTVSPP